MIALIRQNFLSWISRNRPLAAALLLTVGLSLIGINWGRVECWNLDNMAFRGVQTNGLPYGGYLKPPLHIYLNHLLVMKPAEALRALIGAEHNAQYPLQLFGARFLTLALFCGTMVLLYRVAGRFCGARSAAIAALLAATSAGLMEFNHFATADSPLLFWMVISFAFAMRAAESGKTRDAILAGALAGLATADKYNGLGVILAVPAAFLVLRGGKALFGKQCWAAACAFPLGFILGNPGAIFDTRNFVQDFLYNLYTTPVYSGKTAGAGYLDFLACFPNLIGWPAVLLLSAGVAGSLLLLLQKRLTREECALLAAAGTVFLFYYLTIGRFPRMADRFVLPVVPFAFLLAAPGWERLLQRRVIPLAALALVLAYNIFCSVEVGRRFLADPRMDAQLFAMKNFQPGALIENTYAPNWDRLPGLKVTVKTMPFAGGRAALFSKIFGQNPVIQKGIEKFESQTYPEDTFTLEGLKKRNPDFVAFSNQGYQFTGDDHAQRFYSALDHGKLGYVIVFDKTWKPRIPWTYPRDIDFLAERMVILERQKEK